eukprot:gene32782-50446_t
MRVREIEKPAIVHAALERVVPALVPTDTDRAPRRGGWRRYAAVAPKGAKRVRSPPPPRDSDFGWAPRSDGWCGGGDCRPAKK